MTESRECQTCNKPLVGKFACIGVADGNELAVLVQGEAITAARDEGLWFCPPCLAQEKARAEQARTRRARRTRRMGRR